MELSSLMRATFSINFNLLDLSTQIMFSEEYKLLTFSLYNFHNLSSLPLSLYLFLS